MGITSLITDAFPLHAAMDEKEIACEFWPLKDSVGNCRDVHVAMPSRGLEQLRKTKGAPAGPVGPASPWGRGYGRTQTSLGRRATRLLLLQH